MMRGMTRGRIQGSMAAVMLTGGVISVGLWGWTHSRIEKHIYSDSGFGGYVGANRKRLPDTPLQHASDAYAAGKYAEAEQIADEMIARANGLALPARSPSAAYWASGGAGHEALLARRILAYSSARQDRFGVPAAMVKSPNRRSKIPHLFHNELPIFPTGNGGGRSVTRCKREQYLRTQTPGAVHQPNQCNHRF